MTTDDPVDRALRLLRSDDALPRPEPALEARLRERHAAHSGRRPGRRLPLALLVLGASGAVAAASGGVEWIRSRWFVVEVDGQQVSGPLQDGQPRTIPFETADGSEGTVRLQRDVDEGGAERTSISIDSRNDENVESEQLEEYSGGPPGRRFPLSETRDAVSLYVGEDDEAGRFEFFAARADASEAAGSRLLVWQADGSDRPVVELARLPFDLLAPRANARFTRRDGGVVFLSLTDGLGNVIEFSWTSRGAQGGKQQLPHVSELESADGAVRVRVESADSSSSSTDH